MCFKLNRGIISFEWTICKNSTNDLSLEGKPYLTTKSCFAILIGEAMGRQHDIRPVGFAALSYLHIAMYIHMQTDIEQTYSCYSCMCM